MNAAKQVQDYAKHMKMAEKRAKEVGKALVDLNEVLSKPHAGGYMRHILKPQERPLAKIAHDDVTMDDVKWDNLQAALHGRSDRVTPPGIYTKLVTRPMGDDGKFKNEGWVLMMSDTPYEIRCASSFKIFSKGDVLIFGLGLGATTIPVLRREEVKSVTVIELNPDVIAMVEPALKEHVPEAKKLKVINDNALTWKPPKGKLYDTVWADIWPDICTDNLPEMTKLRRRFGRLLNRKADPRAYFGVWEEHYLKRQRSLSQRY
jgi:hypothetical protein